MKFKPEFNLNTILLLVIIAILLVFAWEFFKPNGIKQMLEAVYYGSNIFTH
jgi:predicted negative regulator of RcsB-dependent stress response